MLKSKTAIQLVDEIRLDVTNTELILYAEIEHSIRLCGDYIVEFLVIQTLPPESEMVVYEFLRQHKLTF